MLTCVLTALQINVIFATSLSDYCAGEPVHQSFCRTIPQIVQHWDKFQLLHLMGLPYPRHEVLPSTTGYWPNGCRRPLFSNHVQCNSVQNGHSWCCGENWAQKTETTNREKNIRTRSTFREILQNSHMWGGAHDRDFGLFFQYKFWLHGLCLIWSRLKIIHSECGLFVSVLHAVHVMICAWKAENRKR